MKLAPRPRVVAIVPAAGRGRRLGLKTKKPFVSLRGVPLVVYALKALNSSSAIDGIIIACEASSVKSFRRLAARFKLNKVIDIVAGGRTRFESVRNCLDAAGGQFDIVLIHDGARPFLRASMIKGAIESAEKFGASVTAVPETDTVKLVNKKLFIKGTLNRRYVFRAQTPQTFRQDLIRKAYAAAGKRGVTDDASLTETLGARVKIIEGSYRNIKITTREDLKIAEAMLCGSV